MYIVALGTGEKGGIDSVIEGYYESGVYADYGYRRLSTHFGRSKFEDIFVFISAFIKVLGILITKRDVVLHMHMSYKGSFWRKLLFTLVGKLFGAKTIVHLHGSEFKTYFANSSATRKKLLTWLIQNVDRFVVLTETWSQYIESISGNKAFILHNYVDFTPDISHNPADRTNSIVFIGAFIDRKGVLDLVRACAALTCDYHLDLCGAGYTDKIKALAKELGIDDKITFHGWVGREQKTALLQKSGVFVLPSYNEGLPVALLEAMACGAPTLITDVGGIPEAITSFENGILMSPGDVEALTTHLQWLLTHPEESTEFARKARQVFDERYSVDAVLPELNRLYEELK